MGSDSIAIPLLDWLITVGEPQVRITAVYTQPDRAVGRGQRVTPNAIKLWALAHDIPVRQPERLTQADHELLANESPDVALVMAYGHILRAAFINAPRLGTLNLHASILPAHRGASPIQSAVASGDSETGVSLMRIVRELDAGPVADIERCDIAPADTAIEIEAKMAAACVLLVARNLAALRAGTLEFKEQLNAHATFCRKLTKADGQIDFAASARGLAARINGLYPWPGCRVEYAGQVLRLGGALFSPSGEAGTAAPGTVLPSDNGELLVATGDGVLELTRLQRPGGRMLSAPEFLRGFTMPAGTVIASQPMSNLVTAGET